MPRPPQHSVETGLERVAHWNCHAAGTNYGTLHPRKTYPCRSPETETKLTQSAIIHEHRPRRSAIVAVDSANDSDTNIKQSAKWTSPLVFGIAFVILAFVALLAIESRLSTLQRERVRADIDYTVLVQELRAERERFARRIALYHRSVAVTHSELRSLKVEKSACQSTERDREPDFASALLGGQIEATPDIEALPSHGPAHLLQPSDELGQCWGFHGEKGIAVVQLATPVTVTHVAVVHLGRSIAAPRDFRVAGLVGDAHFPLGSFRYDLAGAERQKFRVGADGGAGPFRRLRFEVTSNHGHRSTCVYRLQVYGVPVNGVPSMGRS